MARGRSSAWLGSSGAMSLRIHGGSTGCLRWPVAVLLLALWCYPSQAQQAAQFLPSIPGVTSQRLVYRQEGFVQNWQDGTVSAVFLADDVNLDPDSFRAAFAQTGGVAVVKPTNNYTITSGNITTETRRPKLNLSGMPNVMLVETGAYLQFNQVHVADIASGGKQAYTFTPSQPYINEGIGYGLWPSVALAPGAQVYMINVSVSYVNPSPLDSCEQYTAKAMFGLRQAYGTDNVVVVNGTAGRLVGPINIPVIVTDVRNNRTGLNASALYDNITFNCLEHPDTPGSTLQGLSPGVLAAAIAVPIVVALAACLLACCCIRRRNLRRRQSALAEEQRTKDLEAGLVAEQYRDTDRFSDQFGGNTQGRRSGSNPASLGNSSSSTLRNFLAIPADAPLMDGILGNRYSVNSTGGSSGSSSMRRMGAAGAAGSSGASILTPVGCMPLGLGPSSSQGVSTESSTMNRLSIDGRIMTAGLSSSAAGTDSSSMGAIHGYTGGTQGTGSGSGEGQAGGSAGSSGGRQTVAERYAGITYLLKARSDIAVLRELKIGPLLGRGSYGRVYRGRWKATTVAVKIIEHVEGAPGTASSGGKKISVGRESLLATSISHPNVETWMIMEFCEKGSLERAVNQGRFIRRSDKAPEMVGIYKALLDTASGLDYLHSIGVVHGDLKTANVLLKGSAKDPRGFMCKITDFGLSRVLDLDATHISTATYGTIVYMPKELLLSGRMTQATDIYSFGLMMWELYTSSRVFDEGLSIGQMFYMIAYQNWRPLIPTDCPPGFADLMTACWHEEPEQRPNAQSLLKRLQKLYSTAKQELAASRKAEAAAAGAGAAAAAAVLNGAAPGSADSARSSQQAPATGAGSAESLGARSDGSGGARAGPSRQTPKGKAGLRTAAAPALAFPGSGSSMNESVVGALSPGASGGQVLEGSGGLGMSGLTVSGGGSDGPKGLGSADGDEELAGYKPYAAAVLQRKRSGSLATGSAASGAYGSAHRSSTGGRRQMQQMQQQQGQTPRDQAVVAAAAAAAAAAATAGTSSRSVGGAGVVSPREAVGSGGTVPEGSISEAYDDPIPSESLLQNFTTDSNIQDGGDTADDDEGYSGYLGHPGGRTGPTAAAQQGRWGAGGAGIGSIEMSARPGGGRWADAAAPQPAGDSSSSFSRDPFSSSTSNRDSFSTGTMPSVVADSWLGSQSSRSFLGSFGGSQSSSRITSSMNMGSGVPPVSPTHASGASTGGPGEGPGAFSEGGGTHSSGSPFAGQLPPAAVPASRSYGTLQTVPENSGTIDGANSPGASLEASAVDVRSVAGPMVVPVGTVPAQQGTQIMAGQPGVGSLEIEEDGSGTPRAPQSVPAGAAAHAELEPAQAPAGPPISPFAALAQRAGSLFGPLKVVM